MTAEDGRISTINDEVTVLIFSNRSSATSRANSGASQCWTPSVTARPPADSTAPSCILAIALERCDAVRATSSCRRPCAESV